MPFLRQEPDNSLAETLGGLGSALGNALNPLNQIRAQDMAAQLRQRQWEVQHAQALDAANQNAANVFENSDLPFDAATKAMVSAGLRNGTLTINNYIDAFTKTGNLKQAQTASALYAAAHPELPPEELASDQQQILQGKSASELDAQRATTALTTLKTTQTQGGVASAQTPAAKEAMAQGQPDIGVKLDAGAQVANTSIDPTAPDVLAQIDKLNAARAAAGYTSLPLGQAPTAALQGGYDQQAAVRAAEAERQRKVAEAIGGGIAPSGLYFPFGPPGSPSNPYGAPPPAPGSPAASTPTQDVALPNASAPFAAPTPITRSAASPANPAAAVVGQSASEAAAGTSLTDANQKELQQAMDEGYSAIQLKTKLGELKDLVNLIDASGPGGQLDVNLASYVQNKWGMTIGTKAEAMARANQILSTEIPDLRKQMGIQRYAGPEIQAVKGTIGSPSMPKDVIMGIIADEEALADVQVERRALAQNAFGKTATPLSMKDYTTQNNALTATGQARADALRKRLGAIGSQTPPELPKKNGATILVPNADGTFSPHPASQ